MAHPEHERFVADTLAKHPWARKGARVLEFGSYDVNGTSKRFFEEPAAYVGVDWREGQGVDIVSLFHEFKWGGDPFDVFICCNTLEHDPHWQESLAAGFAALRSGGLFIFTVPWGYPPHEVGCSPKEGYYQNIKSGDLFERMPHGAEMHFIALQEPPETHVAGIMP